MSKETYDLDLYTVLVPNRKLFLKRTLIKTLTIAFNKNFTYMKLLA